jgi:hypothetical protein
MLDAVWGRGSVLRQHSRIGCRVCVSPRLAMTADDEGWSDASAALLVSTSERAVQGGC